MLTIHESFLPDGSRTTVALSCDQGELILRVGETEAFSLPRLTLERVMQRYGRPLATDVHPEGQVLDLGQGASLVLFRHLARYDVIGKDFLVFREPDREPLAELASAVSAALVHLARASMTE